MPTRRKNSDPENQPNDLSPLTALHRIFSKMVIRFGRDAQNLCPDYIHESRSDDYEEQQKAFDDWWSPWKWRPPLREHFLKRRMSTSTPSEIISAYVDSYIETVALTVRPIDPEMEHELFFLLKYLGIRRIFTELVDRKPGDIAWAAAQMREMVRANRNVIRDWVRVVRAQMQMDEASTQEEADTSADEFVSRMDEYTEEATLEAVLHPPPRNAKETEAQDEEWVEKDQAIAKAWKEIEGLKDKSEASCAIQTAMTALDITKETFHSRIKAYNRAHPTAKLPEHPNPKRAYVKTALGLRGFKPTQKRNRTGTSEKAKGAR